MKKLLFALFLIIILGISSGPKVDNKEYLSFEYNGYKVDTLFEVDSYKVIHDKDRYIIKANTVDNHELEICFDKAFDGHVEVKEKIDLECCEYSYYVERDEDNIIDSKIVDCTNLNLSYTTSIIDSYCQFNGYLVSNDCECMNEEFYVIEDGSRRSDINEKLYIDVKRL